MRERFSIAKQFYLVYIVNGSMRLLGFFSYRATTFQPWIEVSRSALGRLRYIDPDHRNAMINTPVQATGADLQKIGLGRLYRELAKQEYDDFNLVNAVHDSILLEVPDRRTGEGVRLIQSVMEEAGDEILKVVPSLTDLAMRRSLLNHWSPHVKSKTENPWLVRGWA